MPSKPLFEKRERIGGLETKETQSTARRRTSWPGRVMRTSKTWAKVGASLNLETAENLPFVLLIKHRAEF